MKIKLAGFKRSELLQTNAVVIVVVADSINK